MSLTGKEPLAIAGVSAAVFLVVSTVGALVVVASQNWFGSGDLRAMVICRPWDTARGWGCPSLASVHTALEPCRHVCRPRRRRRLYRRGMDGSNGLDSGSMGGRVQFSSADSLARGCAYRIHDRGLAGPPPRLAARWRHLCSAAVGHRTFRSRRDCETARYHYLHQGGIAICAARAGVVRSSWSPSPFRHRLFPLPGIQTTAAFDGDGESRYRIGFQPGTTSARRDEIIRDVGKSPLVGRVEDYDPNRHGTVEVGR